MSGHSKWAQIKHKKAITDARKGKLFSKLSAQISVSARSGGDPGMNPTLRLMIDKARAAGMTKDIIDRAVKRGTSLASDVPGQGLEQVRYGAIGPAGIAIVIDVVTDNKNRTINEIRSTLGKLGGKFTDVSSVAYLFEEQGKIEVKGDKEAIQLAAIDANATDFQETDDGVIVYTQPRNLEAVKRVLEEGGASIESAELSMEPNQTITTNDPKATQLLETLDELDDVTAVYTNLA